jgi:histidine triad (HIT) family protein
VTASFLTVRERHPRFVIAEPLAPIAPGHAIVFLDDHLDWAESSPVRLGHLMERAVRHAQSLPAFNLVASSGISATQTIGHAHIHIIPRGPDDGLQGDWPWRRGGITDLPT